jgi:hypothetical protein
VGQKAQLPGHHHGLVKTATGATPESVRTARRFNNRANFSSNFIFPALTKAKYSRHNSECRGIFPPDLLANFRFNAINCAAVAGLCLIISKIIIFTD